MTEKWLTEKWASAVTFPKDRTRGAALKRRISRSPAFIFLSPIFLFPRLPTARPSRFCWPGGT
jgi:hypothetical protein